MPTPVGAPPGMRWEIEFTPSTWTDVAADVEFAFAQPQTHYGRTSPFSQPGPASMAVSLRNPLGRYTPLRQVLTDGTTPHPFWPNVVPRKRIRFSYTVAGVQTYRYFGYLKGFPPSLYSGVLPVVPLTATDWMDQLSRVKMKSPLRQEVLADSPDLLWPLTEDSGSTQAQTAPIVLPAAALGAAGAGPALTFGDAGPGVGDGTGVKFSPAAASSGQYLAARLPASLNLAAYTIECFVNAGTSVPAWEATISEHILGLTIGGTGMFGNFYIGQVGGVDGFPYFGDDTNALAGPASIVDGGWHHLAATRTTAGGNVTVYVDGVSAGTFTGSVTASAADTLTVGDATTVTYAPGRFQGNVGYVAVYDTALSAARIAAHAAPRNGFAGDTTDARVSRFLGFGGVTTGLVLDAGQTTVGTYPQLGKDVVSACQDMATTEGGVFWVRPAGGIRFANRRYRDTTTPVLTLDASIPALLDPDVWDPAYDETTLVNTSTVSRSAESGTLSTQTYTDTVSLAAFGESDADVTTYTQFDQDALNLAQAQVAGNAYPAFRLNQLAVNFHAATSSLYAQLAAVEIGSRIRIINIPAAAAPMSTLDLFVEGWTETPTPTTYRVVFDTSPVVAERMKIGDATYGKLGCNGQTLNTALPATSAPVSVVIATSGTNPTFTLVAGEYPTSIKIGEEVITLPSAPGGSTSPQTFTGCLRGQQGTFPAFQAAGSVVTLWPRTGLAL